jgi:hypothetical protein
VSAVPTSAWHRVKLDRDDITYSGTSKRVDMVTRARLRECDIKTSMEEVQTLPQLYKAGADQAVRNCFLLNIYFILFVQTLPQ